MTASLLTLVLADLAIAAVLAGAALDIVRLSERAVDRLMLAFLALLGMSVVGLVVLLLVGE
ncbi:MAG: hypothetical protein AB1425_17045 [Actinomycetota bacterium]|uniref:hypothetical protein n=1 Tax=Rubrobacter xylanophilus TaxID=49319 RepID=UPI001C64197E|nr:hypothetical protein [Rubrobacter xylanophilus]QYJ14214.1 hypothetical protein Rxycam_00010 [Rubrobacter xylanophilus DSM 9941]